ncbi:12S rRNA N(4)-cytidine methyltransferase METTL15 isoform X2 [Stigmatopora nigra]
MIFHIPSPSRQLFQKRSLAVQSVMRFWNLKLNSQTASFGADSGSGPSCKSEEQRYISTEKPPHMPVMLKEVLHYLDIQPGHVVLDMTFGGGGHTKAILEEISDVTVLALDRDPTAIFLAQELAKKNPGRVRPLLGLFSELESLLSSVNVRAGTIDAVLLDAGCSSMQLDRAERGFSLSKDGPLDMRMDGMRLSNMPCAADVVNTLDQQALASILTAYGEERNARKIASAIVEARRVNPITRTQQLANVVAGSFPKAAVYSRLQAAQRVLRSGGRFCVITFHSLEDRLVKRFLQGDDLSNFEHSHFDQLKQRTGNLAKMKKNGNALWHLLSKKVITPERDEVNENARGRSAKLRVALRC